MSESSPELKMPLSLQSLIIFATLALALIALSYGRPLLVPFVVAMVLVYLINSMARSIHEFKVHRWQISMRMSYLVAGIFTTAVIWFVTTLIADNVAGVAAVATTYQDNLNDRINSVGELFGLDIVPFLQSLSADMNIGAMITGIATSLASIAGSMGIILVYMLFLFLEQKTFPTKLSALVADPKREQEWRELFRQIDANIRDYVNIKTLVSVITAILAYATLKPVGVDFSEFWALLIFILNFIPTFGSIIGTIFPIILTLVQFDSYIPFLVVAPLLIIVQFVMGNVVEPRLMGNSLGISPLVILLSLALWGMLWGIVGMLLCVPITVILVIILAHFPRTRGIAILLSAKGKG